ncbi:hypothetical protein KSP40_PGU019483 [Platanthera guangdongensis]|uniref:Uncharacterized protein n=1 Tax=Platanthera guangdongensis TaxID=2320717 RepID=A0ABR2LW54_9ASPA
MRCVVRENHFVFKAKVKTVSQSKRRLTKYFDKHIRVKQFVVGDLVMKKIDVAGGMSSVVKAQSELGSTFHCQRSLEKMRLLLVIL